MRELAPVHEFTWRMDGRGRLWVETTLPGYEGPEGSHGWLAAALLIPDGSRLVIAEIRVIPDAGRYESAKGAKPTTFKVGVREWTIGPPQLAKGGGEWTRNVKDLTLEQKKSGVTTDMLRAVPLAAIRREVMSHHEADLPKAWKVALRAGQPHDDKFYAEWARRYVEHGGSLKKLSSRYRTTYARVNNYIHEARVRELLTPTQQGRSGGVLTPDAYRILAATKGDKSK